MFGYQITEQTLVSPQSAAQDRYRQLVVIGTSATGTTNALTEIKDLSDFIAKFGNASPSLPYFRFVFNNDNLGQNRYYFINGRGTGTPTQLDNIQSGITQLAKELELEPSVIIAPEAFTLANQADRTAIYTTMHNLASGKQNHLLFVNTAIATTTKAAALTERNAYQSANGDASLFYEFYEDTAGSFIPVALHAAVILLTRGFRENPYEPPSGVNYPAQGIVRMRNNNIVTEEVDYNDFKNNSINISALIPKGKYCICISRTLATDQRWLNINTRVAATITSEKLKVAILPFLQTASDPGGTRGRAAERACYGVMDDQFADGALTSDESGARETAFKIVSNNVPIASKRVTQLSIYARFVETTEMVQIALYNVDVLP